jgi:translation initiation factor IF-1
VVQVQFLAKIRKNKIRVPPTQQFRDGDIVKVTINPVEEVEEEKEED